MRLNDDKIQSPRSSKRPWSSQQRSYCSFKRLPKISNTPGGAAVAADTAAFPDKGIVTGKRKLKLTATIAAKTILKIYNTITLPNLAPSFPFAWAIAAIIIKNTKNGAIAFKVLINKSPIKEIPVAWGTKSPNTTPIIKPIIIFTIKLISTYFFIIFNLSTLFFSIYNIYNY